MSESKWGGNRPNSGRKPEGERPKVKITITLSADLLELIDELAEINRSLAISAILINHFEE